MKPRGRPFQKGHDPRRHCGPHSEASRAKMGRRGRSPSAKTRARISRTLTGCPRPDLVAGMRARGKGEAIRCRTHPHANKYGLVKRSRIVWEFAHHQFLPSCLVIHHIDGNHFNNDPGDVPSGKVGNLAPMFVREHARWHNWENNLRCAARLAGGRGGGVTRDAAGASEKRVQ